LLVVRVVVALAVGAFGAVLVTVMLSEWMNTRPSLSVTVAVSL
jgi:hypothetical protein